MPGDELEIVEWVAQRQRRCDGVTLGIGDDMAELHLNGRRLLVTSDMLLDGVHFDSAKHDPAAIGRKALACSLSDCAAMAVKPIAAMVSLGLPSIPVRRDSMSAPRDSTFAESWSMDRTKALMEGMFQLAEAYELAIVGGDTNRWPGGLAIDVTVLAEPYPGLDPVLRSGTRKGDSIYVTGRLGGSLLGRHLTFEPRVFEARRLREALGGRLHAMMDLSDGLSLDLWRMCQASGVGATLDETQLDPAISDDGRRMSSKDGRSPLDHALADGEDFELLLAVEGKADPTVINIPLTRIGTFTDGGLSMRRADGQIELLEPRGFVH
jgi:thiamine-monophosphate kinase